MELSIIILNWNAAADTIRCAATISAWQQIRPTIFVVDNASSDGSCELIARECPQVKLICNQVNQGFAGGNNRGIEAALAVSQAPILLLNNDAAIAEVDTLRLLQTLQADDAIGFIGPVLYDADCPDRLLSAGSKDPARHHHSHNQRLPAGGPIYAVECIPGTAIIGRAQLFRQLGLLDEAYFFASEVADLCLQAGRHGYKNVIDSRARAFHGLKRSSSFRGTLYPYYIVRNRFLLIRKFHRRWQLLFYAFWVLYGLALSLKVGLAGSRPMARAILMGVTDGVRGRFGCQNERVLDATGLKGEAA